MNLSSLTSTCIRLLTLIPLAACSSGFLITKSNSTRAPQSDQPAVSGNPGVIVIKDASNFNQVMAISDVHGMYSQTLAILEAARVIDSAGNWSAGNSLLVVVGDSIDKGPQSLEVLDLWIRLQRQAVLAQGQLVHVLGNHEAEFLADPAGDAKAIELLAELKAKKIPLSDLTSKETNRGQFLHDEPLALVVGQWLFCHSGYYPEMTWPDFVDNAQKVLRSGDYSKKFLLGDSSILEAKDWEKKNETVRSLLDRLDSIGIYGEVFGHQPGAFKIKGRSAAKFGGRLIKIDNGMSPEGGSYRGSLLVFTHPKEMNSNSYPRIQLISSNGTSQSLNPE